ncbi:permease prefix domain 1-containing protein [Shouchella sp. JSM 1781072]|uniref:permease prefix domain 1-containing protein n=1 Tax=Shouchella sp. JSM 1781072 TaxID=3344581 RepID=UPI0035C1DC76
MSSKMDSYLRRIVNQTDCSKEERQDMFEEMRDHLLLVRQDYMEEGYSKIEAEAIAMKEFGHEATIGDGLQQAMFPYRREFLLFLAIGSYLFVCVQYFYVLFTENVAIHSFFVPAIAHALLLFFALNQTYAVNRKLWLNLSLVLNILLMVLFAFPDFTTTLTWDMIFYSFLALSIFLIYRTALTYPQGGENISRKRFIHIVNITTGFLLLVFTGFFFVSFAIFAGFQLQILLNFLIPHIIWFLIYLIQIRLTNVNSKWTKRSYILWLFPVFYATSFIVVFYLPSDMFGSGFHQVLWWVIFPLQSSF